MTNKPKQPLKIIDNLETLSLVEHIEIIATQSFDSQLSQEFQDLIHPHAQIVAEFFEISEVQSIFLSVLISLNLQSSSLDFAALARFFDVNCISIAKYVPDIKILTNKKLIRATVEEHRKRRRQTQLNAEEYYVSPELYDAMLKGEKFVQVELKAIDVFDFLKTVGQIVKNKEEYPDDGEFYTEIQSVLEQNQHLQFVQDLRIFNLEEKSLVMFLFVCSIFCDDPDEDVEMSKLISYILPELRDSMRVRKLFLNGEHALQKFDLLETEKGSFKSDNLVSLTEKSIDMLVGDNKDMFARTKIQATKQFQIIAAKGIVEKRLFYSEEDQKEIDFIIDTLRPENYQTMMERLADENLPSGLCMLFYGEAGTSKTQLCYTIAKKTGRDIINFQLSEVKSMFYGESQKLIKRAFDHYRDMVEKSSVVPILLLNEADGILSKRSNSSVNQGVQQTENAIQTIILNELENLNGILIATTNLQNHFDPSFYRRFLIKKKFEKPSAEVRKKIWADKLPWLVEHELELLSEHEITGAIIENVQRKIVMQRALYGTEHPDLDLIIKYLDEENINKTQVRSKIGFVK